ncbi:transcriptional regulator with XRE-family HTH domain [Nocardiopsis metallicus]|uniref:Transcriptional regulator with XRE-family HTH domain n=1 Tax=Nocardiopsis metallicus TaxID=179819 RepID=A0A840W5Y9_9ACTN|nr:transcriptional regulator with XRE-family HTH domain [Nocardiopsis metallicus]
MTRHLSQSALARLTGTSQATISMWESGKRSPDRRRAILVLQELGTPGAAGERSWRLPDEAPSEPSEGLAQALRVVITAPVPIDVQVSSHTDEGPLTTASFLVQGEHPRLVVTPSSSWGITTSPSGVTTAWVALENPKPPPPLR